MQRIDLDYRQMRIIAHSLTLLHYKDAVVDGILIGEHEFNALMDKMGEHIGVELRQRQELDQDNIRRFMVDHPDIDRRHGPNGPKVYSGPYRRKDDDPTH